MFLRVVPELENDRAAVAQIANQIELMIFRDFIAGWALLYESFDAPGEVPQFADDKAWVAEFARNHPLLRPPSNLTNWCVRFVLDRSRLILKSLSLETVVERLRALHKRSAFVIHTPENASEVVVRVYLTSGAFTRQARELDLAQAFVEGTLMASTLRGVDGITSAYVAEGVTRHRRMPDGSLKTVEGTYAIRTAGSNISGVLAVEGIDPLRVVSSSVGDTERVFGICASRGRIASEIARFLGGKAPNTAHMLLYADVMTRLGRVTSLEKGGLTARERNNILLRMALADPVTPIRDAAIHGTSCKVYGISAPLILGTTPQIGTTYNEFVVDEDYCREHLPPVDDLLDAI
jgi:DNA-directed RNA polymerase II subunit RPB1